MRYALLLAAVCLALPAQADEAAAIWANSCARCHRDAEKVRAAVPGAEVAARTDWLRGFLPGHHAPDVAAVAALSDWLAAR